MLHALERRSHPADHGPSFASLFPPLAAVSSAAIPVRVKLKIPRANAAAATTLDIPSRWDPRANQSPTGALVAVLRTAALSRVVVPSVCFTPWSGVRIPLTTAPASLPCTPLFVAMRHLPPTGGSLCSLAAVSSAAIPVWVKLKIPRANAAAATILDIPTGWDPNTKKEPTGLFFAACGRPCSFDSSYGLHEKIPDPKIRDFIHDPYGNRTHVTAVKGPCLNRLTNGP